MRIDTFTDFGTRVTENELDDFAVDTCVVEGGGAGVPTVVRQVVLYGENGGCIPIGRTEFAGVRYGVAVCVDEKILASLLVHLLNDRQDFLAMGI